MLNGKPEYIILRNRRSGAAVNCLENAFGVVKILLLPFAAEAVIQVHARRYRKRGGFLMVERTAAPVPGAVALQRDIAGRKLYDVRSLIQIIQPLLGVIPGLATV